VTAVGGVSLSLDHNKQVQFQTAWGNNITEIADTTALGSPPIDPPNSEGFDFGGGGGTSDVYPQPSFQHGLGGQRRLVPDISWLADPFTGVEIIFSADAAGDLAIEVIGGTSLACPMFSALWGIATQRAGTRRAPARIADLSKYAVQQPILNALVCPDIRNRFDASSRSWLRSGDGFGHVQPKGIRRSLRSAPLASELLRGIPLRDPRSYANKTPCRNPR
jgi:subtilase family serine protease